MGPRGGSGGSRPRVLLHSSWRVWGARGAPRCCPRPAPCRPGRPEDPAWASPPLLLLISVQLTLHGIFVCKYFEQMLRLFPWERCCDAAPGRRGEAGGPRGGAGPAGTSFLCSSAQDVGSLQTSLVTAVRSRGQDHSPILRVQVSRGGASRARCCQRTSGALQDPHGTEGERATPVISRTPRAGPGRDTVITQPARAPCARPRAPASPTRGTRTLRAAVCPQRAPAGRGRGLQP